MASNKSMVDSILEIKRELDKQDVPEPFRELTLTPAEHARLRRELSSPSPHALTGEVKKCFDMEIRTCKPELKEPCPDQKEMDNLASKLTEAVLQLRAGDMEGARATLNDADRMCDVRIYAHPQVPSQHPHLLRYGSGMTKYVHRPSDSGKSVTEQLLRQQIYEQQMRQMLHEMDKTINSTLYPSHILSDNTTDPTDPTKSGV